VVAVPQGARIADANALVVDTLEGRQPQELWLDAQRHRHLEA